MKPNIIASEMARKGKKENAAYVGTLDFRSACSDATDATTDFNTYIAAGCILINWN
jgi:hypothetical protein